MDIRYTNYNKCLTNVANSILKYYDLKTYHSTLKELDDILEEKRYKNIILMPAPEVFRNGNACKTFIKKYCKNCGKYYACASPVLSGI